MTLSRRDFLHRAGHTLAASALTCRAVAAGSANDRLEVAVLGLNGRGRGLANLLASQPRFAVRYLCDVDARVLGPAAVAIGNRQMRKPQLAKDFRRTLEDSALDAVVIATPDHWHAPATLHACLAGKHVYVEKPVSHNLREGRRMVQAARQFKRVVQAGTQRRSSALVGQMANFVREGAIGKIHFARAWINSQRPNIGFAKDEPTPQGVDYDLWLGAAPARSFNRNHFHYNWHWLWEYGTGELGNNGIHMLDVARWALGVDYPRSIASGGGKHFFHDDQQTPDTHWVAYEYPGLTLMWEHRTWTSNRLEGSSFGVALHGTKGTVIFDQKGWRVQDGNVKAPERVPDNMDVAHVQNWHDCISSGKQPNADIETAHISTALCHLGNIAYRLGRKLDWDGQKEEFTPRAADATALLAREYRKGWELPSF